MTDELNRTKHRQKLLAVSSIPALVMSASLAPECHDVKEYGLNLPSLLLTANP